MAKTMFIKYGKDSMSKIDILFNIVVIIAAIIVIIFLIFILTIALLLLF